MCEHVRPQLPSQVVIGAQKNASLDQISLSYFVLQNLTYVKKNSKAEIQRKNVELLLLTFHYIRSIITRLDFLQLCRQALPRQRGVDFSFFVVSITIYIDDETLEQKHTYIFFFFHMSLFNIRYFQYFSNLTSIHTHTRRRILIDCQSYVIQFYLNSHVGNKYLKTYFFKLCMLIEYALN